MRAMVTCRVALESPSDQQVGGVRLISHRQQVALWRHLHCGFISCGLRLTQNEEMQTSQSPEAADRSRRRRPKRLYACGLPTYHSAASIPCLCTYTYILL